MSTQMQEAAVEKLVELGGKSVSRAMRESKKPYSPKTAQTPSKLTKSKGYHQLLEKYGLTEKLIAASLVDDIKAKPQERTAELRLGAEILNMNKREDGGVNKTLVLIVTGETATRYGITPTP